MKNKEQVESDVSHHLSTSNLNPIRNRNDSENLLSLRMRFPVRMIPAIDQTSLDQDNSITNIDELNIRPAATLPAVQKIPPFTTWKYTTRNRKMTEDQSVKGKGHTAPCEEQHEFSEGEKRIIRMVLQDYEPSEKVVKTLKQFISGTTSEIREELNRLNQNDTVPAEVEHDTSTFLDKSLASNLDTFDTLFCRRCLVFDCGLHGNNQPVITPAERLECPVPGYGEHDEPCGVKCYKCLDSTVSVDPDKITWKLLEKDLYLKGLEIFGRNSCLIARNLLGGLKTCMEVYTHMHNAAGPTASSTSVDHKEEENIASGGRKGKGKKGGGRLRKKCGDGKQQSEKEYTPCQCNSVCGKHCSCLKNSTFCEKYCGCSKSCKNRFRGCQCVKTQCKGQQCPCFAAGRECDPDICRNCWVSCGDGSLGEPSRREGQCGNMRILLRQRQPVSTFLNPFTTLLCIKRNYITKMSFSQILMGISDVVGWGAFIKNTVEKDEYIGEYTGELISHEEADLRGGLYDRANSSFLFNLNDQYVIDALHQGNKLKFANHSANPNCQAAIKRVKGDHRVGIFAKRHIEAGEELFYDYCYAPEQLPFWARKPDDPNGSSSDHPQARSKKPQPNDPNKGPSVPSKAQSKKPQFHR
ncbi:hypothetical protein SSX86_011831 [Deinandra increscens subsp. villosa]|uniref:Uncharacterized protein n=1 Tax=Deinandra increscens subsp. villosa TaxID=3103831 RepID=A0AAP0D323_9ASTR